MLIFFDFPAGKPILRVRDQAQPMKEKRKLEDLLVEGAVPPKLVDAADVAKRLNVSARLVHLWSVRNVIPTALRQGRVVRFDLNAVAKALKLDLN